MRPGNIDVALSGGLGAFIYPYLEPQIDIGLIPLGPVTLSAGAVADIGYCLLCNLLQVLDTDWRLSSYYFGVYGRVLAHLSFLTDAIGGSIRIDPYGGVAVGPRLYSVRLDYLPTSGTTTARLNSIIIAPQVGARLFFSDDSRWFGFAEAQYQFEVGFQSTTVAVEGQTYTITDDFASGGTNIGVGFGLRL